MRKRLSSSLRILLPCAALAIPLCPQRAFAQKEGGAGIMAAQESTEPNYVFPYFILVLSTGLGIWLLAKPSRRKNLDEKDSAPA